MLVHDFAGYGDVPAGRSLGAQALGAFGLEIRMKWGIERSPLMTRMSQLPVGGRLIRQQYDRFLRFKYELNWRWIQNPASSRSFQRCPPNLNALQKRLIEELHDTGVASCHFAELFQDDAVWQSLSKEASEFSSDEAAQSVIKRRQQEFGQTHDFDAIQHYIFFKYPQDCKPLIKADNPLLNFHLNPLILDVANSYLAMWSKLIYFDIWYTVPLNTGSRFASQRWHRDPEDRRKIRTFLYFSRVDRDSGAMEYFLGSHYGGPYERVFPWNDPLGIPYPPEGEVERQIPKSQHVILEGPPGTLIFCDTAGFHRGGISRAIPRILATSAFVTPASLHRRRYEIDATVRNAAWSASARFAVA